VRTVDLFSDLRLSIRKLAIYKKFEKWTDCNLDISSAHFELSTLHLHAVLNHVKELSSGFRAISTDTDLFENLEMDEQRSTTDLSASAPSVCAGEARIIAAFRVDSKQHIQVPVEPQNLNNGTASKVQEPCGSRRGKESEKDKK
jgi:hypothetical protein